MITFKKIKRLAESFPGTEVSTSYGTPAIKVGKKLVLRMHQKEDAIVLLLGTVDEQRELIQRDPMAFFITDHSLVIRPSSYARRLMSPFSEIWSRSRGEGWLGNQT